MRLYESIQSNLKENELTDEELTNLYYMDRVLRCMNDEDALSDGWLMYYIADGDSDFGVNYIIDEYKNFLTKEDYNKAYNYYKRLVSETKEGGIIAREFYKGERNINPNAGATADEIAFVKKDFPDIEVITK